jgi:hypothetical protein
MDTWDISIGSYDQPADKYSSVRTPDRDDKERIVSRGQINQTFGTAAAENTAYNANAQDAFGKAQADLGTEQNAVNSYESQLSKFSAANPYVKGGEYATSQNQSLADTANAGANATAQALQTAAVHSGTNPAQAIAASEEVSQQNQRTLGNQEATDTTSRIGSEAGYNEKALSGYQTGEQMQSQITGQQGTLAEQQGGLAQGALGTELGAAEWHDPAADAWNQALAKMVTTGSGGSGGGGGCWIAAELWDGWEDKRVKLVRLWLWTDFNRNWYAPALLWAYGQWGQRMAEFIRTESLMASLTRRFFSWLFGKALKRAQRTDEESPKGCLDGE